MTKDSPCLKTFFFLLYLLCLFFQRIPYISNVNLISFCHVCQFIMFHVPVQSLVYATVFPQSLLPSHQLHSRHLCFSPQLLSLPNHPQYLVSRLVHVHCQVLTVTHVGIRFVFYQVYHCHIQVFFLFQVLFCEFRFFGILALPCLFFALWNKSSFQLEYLHLGPSFITTPHTVLTVLIDFCEDRSGINKVQSFFFNQFIFLSRIYHCS